MTYAWGDETVSGQGIDSRCYPSSTKDDRLKNRVDELGRRQQQEHYRRSERKERKQKNTSISSLPSMQSSSLRSILKPCSSTENLVLSNYLDKRCRIEDIDGNVPPGVQAYWMRDQQLRKSLKRGKKVQFNEHSNNSKRKVGLPGKNSKSHENADYHIYDEVDSDGRMSARVMKSDEESYCKKRVCTPVASRRAKQHTGNENNVNKSTRNKENASNTLPRRAGKFDHYDGSSSSNYSYSSKEITTSQECLQNVPNPQEAERCMFVRSCVKVAGDPNEDVIAFNELRRQSINRMNAFVRSSGRYSQRGYQAYSSAVNKRINAPTRRSMHGNPNFAADGRDLAGAHGNHVYVPVSSVYANDFARSSLRMSSRGVPKNWPGSGSKAPEAVPERRPPGTFERSYVRGSRRSRQSVSANRQDGATTRGSTRRQSQRRRTVIGDSVVVPEARESVRRSKYRRDDRGSNSCARQSMKGSTRNQPEVQPEESQFKVPVTHLSTSQQDTYPSSSSSSPYYVRHTAPHVANAIHEETNVLPEAPPFCRTQQITSNNVINQETNVENFYETSPMQLDEEQLNVPGGGGVPTVGGESNHQRNIMLPLAEAVVAGAMRRSARQKKRGIAYFTMRKSRGEAASDLEVISEDQPGRLSPANTDYNEGHWSAPESRTVVKRPVVPPKPPPRLDKIMAQQNAVKQVPTFAGNAYYKEPVPVKAVPSNPLVFTGRPKRQRDVDVDDDPISLTDAAQQLEKQFAQIARRSPPMMQPSSSSPSPLPDSAPTPTPSSQLTEEASPDVSKDSKSKKQGKKSKKNRKKKKKEEKEEKEAEKKAKKKEEKEKKEKKKDKKKKKKKDKAKTKGDTDAVDRKKPTPEGAQESENANFKPVPKKAPLKPPRKRSSDVANTDYQQSGLDAESVTDEQGHLTVINVVSRGADDNENDDALEGGRYKRKSGLTRLTRKISDRVGTWGKDFKRLLSFRRQKPREDASSGVDNEDSDINDVHENTEEITDSSARKPVVGHAQMNVSGAYLPPKSQPKVPLLPPKCIPVPPPNVPTNKTDEDGLNFCDEGKTNQIIYWLQNAYNNENIEEQLAMLTATTVATQF